MSLFDQIPVWEDAEKIDLGRFLNSLGGQKFALSLQMLAAQYMEIGCDIGTPVACGRAQGIKVVIDHLAALGKSLSAPPAANAETEPERPEDAAGLSHLSP